ncbi:hypothetical protein MASR1M59_16420 [Melaminivora sp.]
MATLSSLFSNPGLLDNQRQNNIDLLRAIAVVSVFIHHAQSVYGGNFPFLGEYGGQFGPQLFFLISGYLISASCIKHPIGGYAIHRIFRIMPAYLLFFVGIGIYTEVITLARVSQTPWQFLANILLLQQLFPAALLHYDVLHVTWTLTVELLWYLLAPLLLWRKRLSTGTVVVITVLSTLWAWVANLHLLDGLYPGITDSNPGFSYLFLANHFFSQVCFFAFGSWIYFHQERLRQLNPLPLLLIGILIFLLRPYYFFFNPIFITGIGLGLFMLAGLNSPAIRNKAIFFISETSYSIYLCHFPILLLVHNQWGLTGLPGLLTSIGLTLLVCSASYVLLEKPAIRLGRRLTR